MSVFDAREGPRAPWDDDPNWTLTITPKDLPTEPIPYAVIPSGGVKWAFAEDYSPDRPDWTGHP